MVVELPQLLEKVHVMKANEVENGNEEEDTPPDEEVHHVDTCTEDVNDIVPYEGEGLPHVTSVYGTNLQDSRKNSRVSLDMPDKFRGLEEDVSPYALTYWHRDALC